MRALLIQPGAQIDTVATALRDWLTDGARSQAARKPSAWHLAQKAVVLLYPEAHRGEVLWPAGWADGCSLRRSRSPFGLQARAASLRPQDR
jgi:hypothetical protein